MRSYTRVGNQCVGYKCSYKNLCGRDFIWFLTCKRSYKGIAFMLIEGHIKRVTRIPTKNALFIIAARKTSQVHYRITSG